MKKERVSIKSDNWAYEVNNNSPANIQEQLIRGFRQSRNEPEETEYGNKVINLKHQ